MKIIEWEDFIKNGLPLDGKFTSMTVGIFDGVHRGHQALIQRIVSFNESYIPVVVTFKTENSEIQSFEKRLTAFSETGASASRCATKTAKSPDCTSEAP